MIMIVVRDSVAGGVLLHPHRSCSEGSRKLGLGLFCANNQTGTGRAGLRLGGVVRIVCYWVGV